MEKSQASNDNCFHFPVILNDAPATHHLLMLIFTILTVSCLLNSPVTHPKLDPRSMAAHDAKCKILTDRAVKVSTFKCLFALKKEYACLHVCMFDLEYLLITDWTHGLLNNLYVRLS